MGKFGNVILKVFVWIFILLATVSSIFCIYHYKQKLVRSVAVKVVYPYNKCMITDSIIKNYLSIEIKNIVGKHLINYHDSIFVNKLKKIDAIEKVKISSTVGGSLLLRIYQKDPYAKIITINNPNYYITTSGDIYYSSNYFGKYRLLFVEGINKKDLLAEGASIKDLSVLLTYMNDEKNLFLYNLTDTIMLNNNGDIELKTRIGEQRVIIGDISNLNVKSDNLRVFYEAMDSNDLSRYASFNLKFDNQIVAINK